MKLYLYTLNFLLLVLLSNSLYAQNGQYDVRFNLNNVDCDLNKIFIDIEVRANNEASTFHVSDQNYRFSYNREAVVVGSLAIEDQFLTGFISPSSFYESHTLTGSLDTIVSYNVVLAGGTGVLVTTEWLTVGRISFEILDESQCLNLLWHDHAPENFPRTFIGGKVDTELIEVTEGLYLGESICSEPICAGNLPVELAFFRGRDENCTITLEWETLTETNNDYFQIEKSTNGEEFISIGTVRGAGTSNQPHHYIFIDEDLNSASNYYRLKQVDFDGTNTVHEAIIVRTECYDENIKNAITSIYPNPTTNGPVNIKFYSTSNVSNAQIIVTDMVGRIIMVEPIELIAGPNKLSFNADQLGVGAYFVKIQSAEWFSSPQKLVKLD